MASTVIRFRVDSMEIEARRKRYRFLDGLSDVRLRELADYDYRALFVLGERAVWSGQLEEGLRVLDQIEARTDTRDKDVVISLREYWTALAERRPLRAASLFRKINLANRSSVLGSMQLVIHISRLKWGLISYVGVGLFFLVGLLFVLVDGWLLTTMLIGVIAAYVVLVAYSLRVSRNDPQP